MHLLCFTRYRWASCPNTAYFLGSRCQFTSPFKQVLPALSLDSFILEINFIQIQLMVKVFKNLTFCFLKHADSSSVITDKFDKSTGKTLFSSLLSPWQTGCISTNISSPLNDQVCESGLVLRFSMIQGTGEVRKRWIKGSLLFGVKGV